MEISPSIRLIQFSSPRLYVQDLLFVIVFLIFFYHETVYPLPYVALTSTLLIGVSAMLLYRKIPYSTVSAVILTLLFQSFILLLGGSVLFFLVLSAISIWRLQVRFGTVQYDGAYDVPFILKLAGMYVLLVFVCVFFGLKEEVSLLTFLLFSAICISVGGRLVEQWLKAEPGKRLSNDVAKLFGLAVGAGSFAYLVIRLFGSSIRGGIEWIILKILSLFFPVIGALLEPLIAWFQGLIAARRPEEETTDPEEVESNDANPLTIPLGEEGNFPWLLVSIGVALIVLILLIVWLMKRKPEFEEVEEKSFESERGALNLIDEEEKQKSWGYSMDSHIIREAFINFETDATKYGYGRNQEETVREWFHRMEWEVETRFFNIYDSVRYGAGTVPEKDGNWFLDRLNNLNENFFKKDV